MRTWLVGLDIGTTSCKAVVMAPDGKEVATGSAPTPWTTTKLLPTPTFSARDRCSRTTRGATASSPSSPAPIRGRTTRLDGARRNGEIINVDRLRIRHLRRLRRRCRMIGLGRGTSGEQHENGRKRHKMAHDYPRFMDD